MEPLKKFQEKKDIAVFLKGHTDILLWQRERLEYKTQFISNSLLRLFSPGKDAKSRPVTIGRQNFLLAPIPDIEHILNLNRLLGPLD